MRVRFIKSGANTQLGGFGPGDTATTSDALAAHLVEAGVAEYVDGQAKSKANPAADSKDRATLDTALAGLPGDQKDPDYVVNGMRAHFGAVFTADDEARVRELVKAPARKPSDGLTVEDIKAALKAKDIATPEGVTKKADLAALLDATQG